MQFAFSNFSFCFVCCVFSFFVFMCSFLLIVLILRTLFFWLFQFIRWVKFLIRKALLLLTNNFFICFYWGCRIFLRMFFLNLNFEFCTNTTHTARPKQFNSKWILNIFIIINTHFECFLLTFKFPFICLWWFKIKIAIYLKEIKQRMKKFDRNGKWQMQIELRKWRKLWMFFYKACVI